METYTIKIKNKKHTPVVREFLEKLNITLEEKVIKRKKLLPRGKFKSEKEFLSFGGSMKGLLISKDHLRELSWKKRNW
jgi:hypothetical protein